MDHIFHFLQMVWFLKLQIPFRGYLMPSPVRKVSWFQCLSWLVNFTSGQYNFSRLLNPAWWIQISRASAVCRVWGVLSKFSASTPVHFMWEPPTPRGFRAHAQFIARVPYPHEAVNRLTSFQGAWRRGSPGNELSYCTQYPISDQNTLPGISSIFRMRPISRKERSVLHKGKTNTAENPYIP